jgi:CCR4-NOT transcriptional complex subunit CAF120
MSRTISQDRVSARSASNYDRDSSPDYASTRKSVDNRSEVSLPKARTGVLKTVGDSSVSHDAARSDLPEIDFGVTQSLTPGHSRPGTAMGLGRSGSRPGTALGISPSGSRPGTAMGLGHSPSGTPERKSPMRTPEALASDDKRSSYFGRGSHSRSPSYAWQPGMAGRQSPGPGLTPEEFVQQRAAAAQQPTGYVPHRSMSTGKIEPTAIAAAKQSPKKLQKKRDSRPGSRGSTHMLDYGASLSAREQEHVARMTGGPLLNLPERSRTPDPAVGLIGAIEAREQEKRYIKEGVSGHMVQAAIAQRQHHAQAQQAQAQQEAQRAYAQQYAGYGHPYNSQQPQFTSWGAPVDAQSQMQPAQARQSYQYPPSQQWQQQQNPQYPPQSSQHQQHYGGHYQ